MPRHYKDTASPPYVYDFSLARLVPAPEVFEQHREDKPSQHRWGSAAEIMDRIEQKRLELRSTRGCNTGEAE